MPVSNCPVTVLIGGSGSNLQALLDAPPTSGFHVAQVISHRPDAYGCQRALQRDVPTQVIDHRAYADPSLFEKALIDTLLPYSPHLILLAGFMRILSPFFIAHFPRQIMNIHPALLPKFKGLHTHQRALEAGEKEHGASVHFVTEELDGGPIIAQVKVPIHLNDTAETLQQRVLKAEHWLYPQIVGWYAQDRLKYVQNIVTLDGKQLGPLGMLLEMNKT